MREPIENEYFNWLCAKVTDSNNSNYFDFLSILHTTEFVWVVQEDKNRAEDGIELRVDFLRETEWQPDGVWENQPCSVLEFFIAFAKKAAFQIRKRLKAWFWEFMTNLGLNEFRRITENDIYTINEIVDVFIWRRYDPDGHGGMFPMSRTNNDQTKIEIWYQFCEYVEDRGML